MTGTGVRWPCGTLRQTTPNVRLDRPQPSSNPLLPQTRGSTERVHLQLSKNHGSLSRTVRTETGSDTALHDVHRPVAPKALDPSRRHFYTGPGGTKVGRTSRTETSTTSTVLVHGSDPRSITFFANFFFFPVLSSPTEQGDTRRASTGKFPREEPRTPGRSVTSPDRRASNRRSGTHPHPQYRSFLTRELHRV